MQQFIFQTSIVKRRNDLKLGRLLSFMIRKASLKINHVGINIVDISDTRILKATYKVGIASQSKVNPFLINLKTGNIFKQSTNLPSIVVLYRDKY